ncbi:hypothetical protein Peur_020500 [Populus x canadensis]
MRCVLSLSVPKVPIFSRDVVLHWNGAVLAKKLAFFFAAPLLRCQFVLYLSRKRPEGLIVLLVESSGIASLFLPSGRTTHSRFEFPLAVDECSHMSY